MCAYISASSQRCVTSIDALSSPGKGAAEWEINCQTMHSSHPLRLSSCQMISKHYRMSGCIIYPSSPSSCCSSTTITIPPLPISQMHSLMDLWAPPQKAPLSDGTFIVVLFSHHSPLPVKTRVAFWCDCVTWTSGSWSSQRAQWVMEGKRFHESALKNGWRSHFLWIFLIRDEIRDRDSWINAQLADGWELRHHLTDELTVKLQLLFFISPLMSMQRVGRVGTNLSWLISYFWHFSIGQPWSIPPFH